jgi:guanine deaminase
MILQGRLMSSAGAPPQPGWVRVAGDRIEAVGPGEPPGRPDAGGPDRIICPGFCDAHVHLPQVGSAGCDGLDLLAWLEQVVFPAELAWADPAAAETGVRRAYLAMLAAGTLGYAGYLTGHVHGAVAALAAAQQLPLRGVAGQALMDRGGPPGLCGLDGPLRPARLAVSQRGRLALSVNPRFAPGCSDALLRRAGDLAAQGAAVQTHLAETLDECALVRRLFPGDAGYAAVYDRHRLLGPRTLLAHCVHLAADEWRLLAERRCVAVHCPSANTFLRSGLFDLDAARAHGVRVALGSDVAAGPDLAMPRVARAMIETAKARSLARPGAAVHVPSPAEAWDLITRGNAEALGFDDAGRLEPGAAADLLVLRPGLPVDGHFTGRLIYTWRDEYIETRVLAGRIVRGDGIH